MSALPAALGRIRPAVEHRLTQVLEDCHRRWEDLGQAAPELLEAAGSVLSGGKRMRAVLGAVGASAGQTAGDRGRSAHAMTSGSISSSSTGPAVLAAVPDLPSAPDPSPSNSPPSESSSGSSSPNSPSESSSGSSAVSARR